MCGPGAYRPDPTEGMTAIADLPPPEIVPSSRTYERQACPRCTHQAYRDKQFQRSNCLDCQECLCIFFSSAPPEVAKASDASA
jgi:hypothetical protein